jgi:hypothetical protein
VTSQFSAAVRELIAKARIVSFATWHDSHPAAAIQLLQAADDEGRYLTDADLEQLRQLVPHASVWLDIARDLRESASDIVAEARERVLSTYPELLEPGGGLYPPLRAEACWRDFWHFLRCVTYGIAGRRTDYTSAAGLHSMELLYRELRVPLDAMVLGLESLKSASLRRFDVTQADALAPYFDRLGEALAGFRASADAAPPVQTAP